MYDPIPALQHSSFASKVQLLTTNPQSDLSLSLKHSRCLHYVWHQCLLRSVMIIPIAYWYRSHCWSTFPANKSASCCGSEYFRCDMTLSTAQEMCNYIVFNSSSLSQHIHLHCITLGGKFNLADHKPTLCTVTLSLSLKHSLQIGVYDNGCTIIVPRSGWERYINPVCLDRCSANSVMIIPINEVHSHHW